MGGWVNYSSKHWRVSPTSFGKESEEKDELFDNIWEGFCVFTDEEDI